MKEPQHAQPGLSQGLLQPASGWAIKISPFEKTKQNTKTKTKNKNSPTNLNCWSLEGTLRKVGKDYVKWLSDVRQERLLIASKQENCKQCLPFLPTGKPRLPKTLLSNTAFIECHRFRASHLCLREKGRNGGDLSLISELSSVLGRAWKLNR